LENTVLSLLDRNLGGNHHIYQDNFYNSVRLAQNLLDIKMLVSGTVWPNRHSTWRRMGEQILAKRSVSIPEERWCNGPSVEGEKTCV